MSRSLHSSRAIVLLAPTTDQTERVQARREAPEGVVLVRDVLAPPAPSVDSDTGQAVPGGWLHPGAVTPPGRGLAWTLGALVHRDLILRVYLAQLAGTAAAWTAAIPTVAAGVDAARDGRVWTEPEAVVVLRAQNAPLASAIRDAWPGAPLRWIATVDDARGVLGALRPRTRTEVP